MLKKYKKFLFFTQNVWLSLETLLAISRRTHYITTHAYLRIFVRYRDTYTLLCIFSQAQEYNVATRKSNSLLAHFI